MEVFLSSLPVLLALALLSPPDVGVLVVVAGQECGTRFTDFSSSVVMAEVVLQGSVSEFNPTPYSRNIRSANVNVTRVYKGGNILRSTGRMMTSEGDTQQQPQRVVVRSFGRENKDECVAPLDDKFKHRDMVFFLRQSRDVSTMEHSALPLPAEGNEEQRISRSLCDTCIEPPTIRRLVCKDCASQPTIRVMKSKKATMGRKAKLRCVARGQPPPSIRWFKDGVPLMSGVGGVTIRTVALTSTLQFARTTSAHSGRYKCVASNGAGDTEDFVTLDVSRKTRTRRPGGGGGKATVLSVKDAPDSVGCQTNLCLNGGTCYYSAALNLRQCVCRPGFEGVRCENSRSLNTVDDDDSSRSGDHPRHDHAATITTTTTTTTTRTTSTHSRTNAASATHSRTNTSIEHTATRTNTSIEHTATQQQQQRTPPVITRNNRTTTTSSKAPQTTTSTNSPRRADTACRTPTLCLNGGTCIHHPVINTEYCLCPSGFQGHRCELRSLPILLRVPDRPSHASNRTNNNNNNNDNSNNIRPTIKSHHATEITDTTGPNSTREPSTRIQQQHRTSSISTRTDSNPNPPNPQPPTGPARRKSANRSSSIGVGTGVNPPRTGNVFPSKPRQQSVNSRPASRYGANGQRIPGYPVKRKSSLKIISCRDKQFCQNRGKCKYISKLDKKFCQCVRGYGGVRCERRLV